MLWSAFLFLSSDHKKPITHHAKQPLYRLSRLGADTQPVLGADGIELDVLVFLGFELLAIGRELGRVVGGKRRLRDGVVGAQHLHGLTITRRLGLCQHNVVDGFAFRAEARESDAEDHGLVSFAGQQ